MVELLSTAFGASMPVPSMLDAVAGLPWARSPAAEAAVAAVVAADWLVSAGPNTRASQNEMPYAVARVTPCTRT